MAAAAAASSSSSSSSTPMKEYDVFLSFRGEDTRTKFTSHLHAKLTQKNVDTYIDNILPIGDEISPALIKAIEGSRISVIILSENFASSTWCLDEVLCILDCKKKRGQIVVTIFYEIDPSHARKQQKSYEAAFEKLEERFKDRMDKVVERRAALTHVANIKGWESQKYNGTEAEFVEAIAKDIVEKLEGLYLSSSDNDEFKDLVGIKKSIAEMEQLLCIDDSTAVRFIGIWGMGGLGKTTLARVLFQLHSSKFQGCCFLENVRKRSESPNGLGSLQKELFDTLLGEKNLDPSLAKKKLRFKKVLIVLDDVDDPDQLEFLAAKHDCFCRGSRILITTRDTSVLRARKDYHIYELKGLAPDDALELFKLKAFESNTPTVYEDMILSERVVRYANGSPLALTVLCSFLRRKRKENWETELKKLEEFPNKKIHGILKTSFDALDKAEQDIFLDIVCLFSYVLPTCRKHIERTLGAHHKYASIGIDSLIDKSLVAHVKDNNNLEIHDLLKDMGWEIERQRVQESGKHSRLWQEKQLHEVLKNSTGTPSAVEVISCFLDLRRYGSPTMFNGMDSLWLLDAACFYSDFPQDLQYLPNSLKCLIWPRWCLESLPSKFLPDNLVELYMPYSDLVQLWSGVPDLKNLKYVDLSRSRKLTDISALSKAPNLVSVDLTNCTGLRQVPPLTFQFRGKLGCSNLGCYNHGCKTLGCLQLDSCEHLEVVEKISGNLKGLNLKCTSVKELPSSILSLDNLEYLDLTGCTFLKSLPSDLKKLKSLRRLNLNVCFSLDKLPKFPKNLIQLDLGGTRTEQVPSIEHLCSLEELSLSRCRRLKSLPIGISKLKSLKRLDLSYCTNLEIFPAALEHLETVSLQEARTQVVPKIPDEICCLSSLEILRLDESNIEGMPASIKNLSKLTVLSIGHCKRLKSLPDLPSSIQRLDATGCVSLESISNFKDALIQELKSGNHVMTYRTFLYGDCLKFDQTSRNSIISEFQLRAFYTGNKSERPYKVLKISDRPRVDISYPGNEVPMWFAYRSESSSINVELSSDWYNTKFLGFALCCAVAENHDWAYQLTCEGNFKTKNGKCWKLRFDFSHAKYFYLPNSSNLFMWYVHENYHDYHDAVEVSFRFIDLPYAEAEVEVEDESKVTACGIRLLYLEDTEEIGIHQ